MIQQIVVGLIVAIAAVVVLKRYAPKALNRAARIGSVRVAKALGWHALADKLVRQAEAGTSCGDGCGTCGNCGTPSNQEQGPVQSVSVEALKQSLRR